QVGVGGRGVDCLVPRLVVLQCVCDERRDVPDVDVRPEVARPAFEPILSDPNRYRRFVQAYQDRARTLSEPAQLGHFFVVEDQQLNYDPKAVKKVLEKNDGQGYDVLSGLQAVLTDLSDWTADAIDTAISDISNRRELGMGKVAQPIRVAVSGSTVSPSIDDTLLILGRRSTLARIERCLEQADD
ncbi:MAG: hypothetical protein R3336_09215, partial [Phycisphaeraceae bacterium]|nr:hypothetical protein [Phycisphaeraceae bacterium]